MPLSYEYKPQDVQATQVTAADQYAPDQAKTAQGTAVTSEVKPFETVQGQMTGLLDSNSDYMKRAEAKGTSFANSRGLLNTSMGAGAAQAASIDAALPIASQDAGIYSQQRSQNQSEQNAMNQLNTQVESATNLANTGHMNDARKAFMDAQNQANQMNAQLGTQVDLSNSEWANKFGMSGLEQRHNLETLAQQQGYNLETMTAQQLNELQKMAQGQQYNLETLGQQFGYDIQKMDKDVLNQLQVLDVSTQSDLVKMAKSQGYNIENMSIQQLNDLQKITEQQKNSLEQMAAQQGYTLEQGREKFGQDRSLAELEQMFNLQSMATEQGHSLERMERQFGMSMKEADFQRVANLELEQQRNGFTLQQMSSQHNLDMRSLAQSHQNEQSIRDTENAFKERMINVEMSAEARKEMITSQGSLTQQLMVALTDITTDPKMNAADKKKYAEDMVKSYKANTDMLASIAGVNIEWASSGGTTDSEDAPWAPAPSAPEEEVVPPWRIGDGYGYLDGGGA